MFIPLRTGKRKERATTQETNAKLTLLFLPSLGESLRVYFHYRVAFVHLFVCLLLFLVAFLP